MAQPSFSRGWDGAGCNACPRALLGTKKTSTNVSSRPFDLAITRVRRFTEKCTSCSSRRSIWLPAWKSTSWVATEGMACLIPACFCRGEGEIRNQSTIVSRIVVPDHIDKFLHAPPWNIHHLSYITWYTFLLRVGHGDE